MTDYAVACICPPDGSRHQEGDTLTFPERLPFRVAVIGQKGLALLYNDDPGATTADVLGYLAEFYLLNTIASWTVCDEKGKPLPLTRAHIVERLLASPDAYGAADFADDLYSEQVIGPLVSRASKSSSSTRTNGSTSPRPGAGRTRKPSKPSSTASTPTVAIAMT